MKTSRGEMHRRGDCIRKEGETMVTRTAAIITALLAVVCATSCRSTTVTGVTHDVTILHDTTGGGDLASVPLAHGDRLRVTIENTLTNCFDYNIRDVRPEAIRAETVKVLEAVHDEATTAYDIVVRRRTGATGCDALPERSWRIPVRQLWNVAFTGGVIRHELTDRKFYLEPGKSAEATPRDGFFVKEDLGARDEHAIVGTGLSHLYLSAPSIAGVAFAPLTFGITVDEQPNYVLGTGVRLGTRAFLTVGRMFGTENRLPTGVAIDDFTTEANLLDDLPRRNADGWFVGISLSFLDRGVANLLQSKIGVPVPVSNQQTAQQQQGEVPKLSLDKQTAVKGDRITITGADFGDPVPESLVRFAGGAFAVNAKEADKITWAKDKIVVVFPDIPQDSNADQPVAVDVIVKGKRVGTAMITLPKKTTP